MTKIIKKIASLESGEAFKFKDKIYTFSGKDGRGHCVREDGKNEHLPLNSYVTLVETPRRVLPYNSSGRDWADNLSDEQIKKSVERFGSSGSRESLRDVADWAANSDPEVTKEIFKDFQQEHDNLPWEPDNKSLSAKTVFNEGSGHSYVDRDKIIQQKQEEYKRIFVHDMKKDNENFSAAQEEKTEKESKAKSLAKKFAEMFTKNNQYDTGK